MSQPERVYSGDHQCCSLLNCYSFWCRYLFRIYQNCSNQYLIARTYLIIGKLTFTFTPSFRSIYESARTGILRRSSVLFFVGLLQLLVSLSVQNLLELQQLVFNCQNFPDHWEIDIYVHTILQKYLHVFLGNRCWSWSSCNSLWFRSFSRTLLELQQSLCN